MDRTQAYQTLTEMIQNKNLVKHGLAVEAIMRALAKELKDKNPGLAAEEFNEEEWGIVGLLHDADYEVTGKDLDKHTLVMADKLREMGVSERIINGIIAHNDQMKPNRENYLEKAVYAADELSGLITAAALVRPDKKLASLTTESILKKFKEKSFAAGAKREPILTCEKDLAISLEEFVAISLKAMQGISDELGL